MGGALLCGVAYFAIAFTAGFLLGVVRVTAVAPRLGAVPAVLIELPLILAVSWSAARWLCRRSAIPFDGRERLVMGVSAFVLLQMAEAGLALVALKIPLRDYLASMTTLPGSLGLAGQILFAAMPLLVRPQSP